MEPLTMVVLVGEDETQVVFPARFAVCPNCEGRGSQIDSRKVWEGMKAQDLSDVEFQAAYSTGRYDAPCSECRGLRVVKVIDEGRLTVEQRKEFEAYQKDLQEEADFARISRLERMNGA